jgi:hypothetical protein
LLESGSFTFSVYLLNAGSVPVTISQLTVAQGFGSGGSPSPNAVFIYPVNWVLPVSSWARYSARLDIPSINGKTIGTNGNSTTWTQIEIDYPIGTVFNINDCFWQLEPCSPLAPAAGWPTAFEYRGQQAEAARVTRYYQSGWCGWEVPGGAATFSCAAWVYFNGLMRGTPNLTMGTPNENTNVGTLTVGPVAPNGFRIFSNNAGPTITLYTNTYIADSRL